MFSRSITTWSTEKIILSAQSHILIPIATRHYKNSYTGGCCNPLYQIKQPRPCYCYCLVCDRKHTWKFNIERCSLSFFRNRRTWSPLAENKPGWTPGPKKTQDFCNDVNYINISILNLLPIQKDMSKCENFLGFFPFLSQLSLLCRAAAPRSFCVSNSRMVASAPLECPEKGGNTSGGASTLWTRYEFWSKQS